MSIATLVIVLLVWAVAGLLAAIAFGKAIHVSDSSPDEEELLPSSVGTVKYIRRNKRSPRSEQGPMGQTHGKSV